MLVGCGDPTGARSNAVYQGKTVNDVLSEGIKEASTAVSESASAVNSDDAVFDELPPEYQTIDVDLTVLSSTMVYSEVYNMTSSPDGYMGKTVRMAGTFKVFEGDGRNYYACLIADATACCAQGIEFILKNERAFPDEYPPVGDKITVVGVFDTYYEGRIRYCQLIDAFIV